MDLLDKSTESAPRRYMHKELSVPLLIFFPTTFPSDKNLL